MEEDINSFPFPPPLSLLSNPFPPSISSQRPNQRGFVEWVKAIGFEVWGGAQVGEIKVGLCGWGGGWGLGG
ncbi:unnamed protein product [Prunus armeniaca]|uniref:Uncharacterized protein n=1 Tax=Prunus armeniaca TaxID=36596 RepID=A0A6J5V1S2_PRUAR|nr:unnamed protein product [Prunus armeniaca]